DREHPRPWLAVKQAPSRENPDSCRPQYHHAHASQKAMDKEGHVRRQKPKAVAEKRNEEESGDEPKSGNRQPQNSYQPDMARQTAARGHQWNGANGFGAGRTKMLSLDKVGTATIAKHGKTSNLGAGGCPLLKGTARTSDLFLTGPTSS